MAIIPAKGILRKLYQDAIQDIQNNSFGFWYTWLQKTFNEHDVYTVTTKFPLDNASQKVNVVVDRYDASADDILPVLLWVELKSLSGSIGQVESEARDAVEKYMEQHGVKHVYVITTIGVSFRAWVVTEDRGLQPFHGGPAHGSESDYITADSNDARALETFIAKVKSYAPKRVAPVIH
ncbi:hypothetical protein F66182_3076 [Fusarium sp. NRRL 66182]|nr:hypothetical protein F66182_3076 [Fusarium sp. NRRL 66182]